MSRTLIVGPFARVPADVPEDAWVITPHRPAADALRRPKKTLQALARKILAERNIFAADPRLAARLLREAIAEIRPGADANALARRFDPVLRTVLRVGIDTAELKRHGSRRACELAAVAEVYRRKLRDLGLVHTDELVWEAAQIEAARKQALIIYGHTRARKEEIAFINRHADDGSVYYLPVIEHAHAFDRNRDFALQMSGWGWKIADGEQKPVLTGERAAARFFGLQTDAPADVAAFTLHSVASEARFVLGRVKELLRGGVPAGDITIVARDLDLYAKEFALVGAEYQVPTMSSLHIPLSETLVGGLVNLLLSAVQGDFGFETTARLLGHPFGLGMSDATWRQSRRGRTEGYEEWAALESSIGCLDDIRGRKVRTHSEWTGCLKDALTKMEVRRRAGHIPREIVAFNCLQEELSSLASDETPVTFAEFASSVRDLLANVNTRFDPSRLGVLVTEPNMIVGGRFRHVFVVGLAEGIFPALPSDNPVIDFRERGVLAKEGLDFEEAADIPRWEAMSFFSVLSTATETLTLTCPRTVGKDEKLESSFFGQLGLKAVPAHPRVLCSQAELTRNSLRKSIDHVDPAHSAAVRQLSIERARESALPCDEYDGVIGEAIDIADHKWSVSQLAALAGCGFRWFAGYGLGLRPADEMDLEISPAARGNLFHYALDFAVSAAGAGARADLIGQLDRALAAAYDDPEVGMPRITNWALRGAEFVSELTRSVQADDFLPGGAEIVATEKRFLIPLFGLQIRGRIDRIDRTPDGLVAVDYKTGSRKPEPVQDRAGRKLDLQLAVYLAALKALYPDENTAGGAYYSLSGCKSHKADVPDEELLEAFLEAVVEAPRTGSLPVRPISANTCTYCDYDLLCRKGARMLRKEGAQ